ncbi:hypothetical protein BGY98DRAFT_460372 [Russula aff. rugulosa BPL654]|nr:hypothetical protein BGY98DRAFT_460372 [Russula aff. rugulosa BPL654]
MDLVVMTQSLSTWTHWQMACEVSMLLASDSFFSFSDDGVDYPYALVHWFSHVGDSPDEHTGI